VRDTEKTAVSDPAMTQSTVLATRKVDRETGSHLDAHPEA